MPDIDELMDPGDCSREAKIKKTTFYDKLRAGTGPRYMRVGRLIRIRRSWFEDWLRSCEVDSDQEAA